MMLTTVITDITPITTPSRVSMVRNLCDHRLAVAMRIASPNDIDVLGAIMFWVLPQYTRKRHAKLQIAKLVPRRAPSAASARSTASVLEQQKIAYGQKLRCRIPNGGYKF